MKYEVKCTWENRKWDGSRYYKDTIKEFGCLREAHKYLDNACDYHNLVDWSLYKDGKKIDTCFKHYNESGEELPLN